MAITIKEIKQAARWIEKVNSLEDSIEKYVQNANDFVATMLEHIKKAQNDLVELRAKIATIPDIDIDLQSKLDAEIVLNIAKAQTYIDNGNLELKVPSPEPLPKG
jgi:capsule polysaccharide export protein KpsE/RkpR